MTAAAGGGRTARVPDPADPGLLAARTVAELRVSYGEGSTRPVAARLRALEALGRGIEAEAPALRAALAEDLGKPPVESVVTEIGYTLAEIDHVRRNLRRWLRPERIPVPLVLAPARARLWRDPLGVVLVLAPWNYPLHLALAPLVGALAGGNAAVLKPSETAPATSAALAGLVGRHLPPGTVRVVEGGVATATALLAERFDHIFFTGSARVGRIVARAAAEHLTPVTLELGGKSPAFVDEGQDLAVVARRLAWGKWTNAGQTCVAPDHVLATRPVLDALVPHLRAAIAEMYGSDPARSADYGRMISTEHAERVVRLIDPEKVVAGGESDPAARYVAPTVVDRVGWEDAVMAEEIFGPVLPLVEVSGPGEAASRIRSGPAPLTAYAFTDRRAVRRLLRAGTASGSLVFGMTIGHLGMHDLPFGGVGLSGTGAYHGRESLRTFTHARPVVSKPLVPDTLSLGYPPATPSRTAVLRRFYRGFGEGTR
jgi:aldehyde dehydrogenase (NAD+)